MAISTWRTRRQGHTSTKGPGNYNDYVQIVATYHVNTITPLMGYMGGYSGISNTFPVHVSAIIKNEPAIAQLPAH